MPKRLIPIDIERAIEKTIKQQEVGTALAGRHDIERDRLIAAALHEVLDGRARAVAMRDRRNGEVVTYGVVMENFVYGRHGMHGASFWLERAVARGEAEDPEMVGWTPSQTNSPEREAVLVIARCLREEIDGKG